MAIAGISQRVTGARVSGVAGDLGTRAGTDRLIAAVAQTDILVTSLGIFEPEAFFDIPDEDWLHFFEVNVMSGVRLARYYAQGMAKRGWGRVQFISSESAVQIPAGMVHYGVTKTAQLAVSRGLAETLADTGVTVNAILPGPTRSEGLGNMIARVAAEQGISEAQVERDFIATQRPSSLIRRLATVEGVASLAVHLASEQASATTGAAMRVDGDVVRSVV